MQSRGHTKKQKKNPRYYVLQNLRLLEYLSIFRACILDCCQLSFYYITYFRTYIQHTHTKHEKGFCSWIVFVKVYSITTVVLHGNRRLFSYCWLKYPCQSDVVKSSTAYSTPHRSSSKVLVEWFLTFGKCHK